MAKAWKPPSDRPAPATGRTWQAAIVLVILLALGGGLLAWLLFPDPFTPPRFLPLAVYEYHTSIPPLAWSRQDADALAALGWSKSSAGHNSQTLRLLKAELEALASHPPGEPLVVYLSGYLLTHDGKPYLFPAEEKLDTPPTGWLPMTDVFRLLRACPARRKLLVLDVMRPLSLPEKGQLRLDRLASLWPLLQEAVKEDSALAILTACSPGQASQSSEELGRGVFGYFLARGLRGEADGWMPGARSDGRVSLKEIADYVRACVDHYSLECFGARQAPALLGGDGGWPLTLALDVAEEAVPLGEYPPWLDAAWKTLDTWHARGPTPAVWPAMFAHARATLEAEARWRAGVEPARARADLESRLAAAAAEYAARAPRGPDDEASLATAPAPAEDEVDSLKRALARLDKLPPKAPEDALKPIQADLDALVKKHAEKSRELAALILAAASGQPFGPQAARALAAMLTPLKGVGHTEEVRFLLRLCGRADKAELWSPAVARLAVEASVEAARLRRFPDEAQEWVAPQRGEAAREWKKAESLLFDGDAGWEKEGTPLLRGLSSRQRAMRQALQSATSAIAARDEAVFTLTCLAFSPAPPCPIAELEKAAAEALALQALLADMAGDREARLGEAADRAQALRQTLASLQPLTRGASPEAANPLIGRMKEGRLSDLEMGRALLSTAGLSTRQRLALWAAHREGSKLRAEKCMEALGPPGPSRKPLPDQGAWEDGARQRAEAALLARGLTSTRAALLRLRLGAGAAIKDADPLLDALKRKPDDGPSWQKLAEVLRRHGG
jgi:hypothetical protein